MKRYHAILLIFMFTYAGFFIGYLAHTEPKPIYDPRPVKEGIWAEAWEKSKNQEIRPHLILEGLWCANESKVIEIAFVDGNFEISLAVAMTAIPFPGSTWDFDLSTSIPTWTAKPSPDAKLILRLTNGVIKEVKSSQCGVDHYRFEYRQRVPLEDKNVE
jgi:hypothetical protein